MTRGPLLLGAEWFDDRPGGLNRYVRDLSEALSRAGRQHRVLVVSEAKGAPTPFYGVDAGDRFLPLRVVRFARAARRLASEAELVDAHFALYAAIPVLLPPLRDLPLIVHFHGPWAEESLVASPGARTAGRVKRRLERAVYRRADRVIVLSDAFGRLVSEEYGVPAERIDVVPPSVDLDRFRPGDSGSSRAALGLAPDAFVAVVARRLEERMGIDVLIDAWVDVVARRPGSLLIIVGRGTQAEQLERRASSRKLTGSVRFVGRLSDDDLVAMYRAADVSVVPTRALEGFGLVVLESLAAGTPVIVTDVGGLPEAVRGLDDVAVVPPESPVVLADALLRVAGGQAPTADACRRHAERFSMEAFAARHREVYDHVTDRRPRVVFVDHCALRSGGELALARLLPSLDVDAHVILGEEGPLVQVLESLNISLEVLPLADDTGGLRKDDVRPGRVPWRSLVGTARSVSVLRRRLRELRPDLVHTNSLKAALYGGLAGRLAGVPVVWHIRDRIADDYLPRPAVGLVRLAARVLPSAVIANSSMTMATLGRVRRPNAVVPSPVEERSTGRPRMSDDGHLRIAIVGRLAPWKGQHVFLEAFARAFPDGDARAVVVGGALFGEHDYAERLHADARRLGIAERTTFTGHVDEIDEVLSGVDVLVHASVTPEPFGQVVVEGMAAGVAVIAAAAGGPAEVVDHGVDGLLHEPGDVEDLAGCLRRLADDPALRERLAARGRRRAAAFRPDRVAPMVRSLYDQVLIRR